MYKSVSNLPISHRSKGLKNEIQEIQKDLRPRKYDKSHVEIILLIRQFFEKERDTQKRIALNKVVERTAEATGASRNIISRIKTEEDVSNWKYDPGQPLSIRRTRGVPENYRSVIRQVVRDLFLEKTRVPTVDIVFERVSKLTVQNVETLNLFEVKEMPKNDALI